MFAHVLPFLVLVCIGSLDAYFVKLMPGLLPGRLLELKAPHSFKFQRLPPPALARAIVAPVSRFSRLNGYFAFFKR